MHILRRISDEFWWDVARKCEYATFFQTPIWRDLVQWTVPDQYEDKSFGAILANGTKVVFPLMIKRRIGPVCALESMPLGGYGGVIADGPISPEEHTQLYARVRQWPAYSFYMVNNPFGPPPPEAALQPMFTVYNDTTYVVPLDSDFETIFARFRRNQRQEYRRGIKRGVKVRLAQSLDDYQAYYEVYRDAVARWGEELEFTYTMDVFAQIYFMSLRYPEQIKLWLITVDDEVAGGNLVYSWGPAAIIRNGTLHRKFFNYFIMPVGDTEVLRDALAQGYRYLDFCNSGTNLGGIEYKQRFTPHSMPVKGLLYEQPLVSSMRIPIYSARRILVSLRNGIAS
jgi:hypothetical protein